MAPRTPILEVRALRKSFGSTEVLKGIDLAVAPQDGAVARIPRMPAPWAADASLACWLVACALATWRVARKQRVASLAFVALVAFFASAEPVEVLFAKSSLHAGDAGFGALVAVWGVGMVAGGIVFARSSRRPLAPLLVGGTLAIGASSTSPEARAATRSPRCTTTRR